MGYSKTVNLGQKRVTLEDQENGTFTVLVQGRYTVLWTCDDGDLVWHMAPADAQRHAKYGGPEPRPRWTTKMEFVYRFVFGIPAGQWLDMALDGEQREFKDAMTRFEQMAKARVRIQEASLDVGSTLVFLEHLKETDFSEYLNQIGELSQGFYEEYVLPTLSLTAQVGYRKRDAGRLA
ncbi:MAG: hypothetical protein V3T77_09135 [Planctomycetota bacterium]